MRHTSIVGLLAVAACHGDPVGTTSGAGGGGSGGSVSGGKGGTGGTSAGGTAAGGTSGVGATGGSPGGGGSAGTGAVGASGGVGGFAGSGGSSTLVPGPEGAVGLGLDDTDAYFGIGKDVWRVPKTGGNKTIVTSGVVKVREVVVAGG